MNRKKKRSRMKRTVCVFKKNNNKKRNVKIVSQSRTCRANDTCHISKIARSRYVKSL